MAVSLAAGVAAAALGRLIGSAPDERWTAPEADQLLRRTPPDRGPFVADALLDLYGRHEIAASILLRGTEGFGLKHHLRTDRSLTLSEDLPLVAVAVDTRPRIEAVLGPTLELNRTGLVTLEGARLLADTAGSAGDLRRRPS